MAADERPAVVAFDGSEEAAAAVRAVATLFPDRRIVVVSVWEPGIAVATAPMTDPTGMAYLPPSADEIAALDRLGRERAVTVADAGARLAQELGATAEAMAISDEVHVADTIVSVAEESDACVVVVGSRGRGGVKSLFGSTSRALLNGTERPVLVVRAPHNT
jgi:nucleotide-binding universal stress UspA family protein